jgi:hypothetical protein
MDSNLDKKIKDFVEKTKRIEKGEKLDLSSNEDLSIGVMNLISIEEHLFFSAGKTGKTKYYEVLNEVREMRKDLLKKLIKDYEGEVWCISKHLLAASMRLMEVGTKALTKGQKEEAYDLFKKSYDLYNLFWGLNLKIVDKGELKKINFDKREQPIKYEKKDILGKVSNFIGKILDCCRE